MAKSARKRLDVLVVERGLAESRAKAQAFIMAGDVLVDGALVDKVGTQVAETADIQVRARPKYVSRGGDKLEGALRDFNYDPVGKIAADVGASTGGFTDCLLQHGAARVYAIDVGYGQLAHKVRSDERVIAIDRTNARYLMALPERVSLVVVDASFISLKLLLPAINGWLDETSDIIALIKPQFEAGRGDVGKGGVVRDQDIHQRVIEEVSGYGQQLGLSLQNLTRSPLKGPAGNVEFLIWLASNRPASKSLEALLRPLFE